MGTPRTRIYRTAEVPEAIQQFYKTADRGSTLSTMFDLPRGIYRDTVMQSGGRYILNMGNLKEGSELDQTQIRLRETFMRQGQRFGTTGVTYSSPERTERLHFKSTTRYSEGNLEALISTANMSPGTVNVPVSKAERQWNAMGSNIRNAGAQFINSVSSMLGLDYRITEVSPVSQLNIAAVEQESAPDLRRMQENLYSGKALVSSGNFLVGADATASIVDSIERTRRGETVIVSSPYLDDRNLANTVAEAAARGVKVVVSTSNPDSSYDRATGGKRGGVQGFVDRAKSGGADISMPSKDDPLLNHTKAVAILGKGYSVSYLGSHNLTDAAREGRSVDAMRMYTDADTTQAIANAVLSDAAKYGLELQKGNKLRSYGFTNQQLAGFFGEGTSDYLLPNRYGASHFHEIALFNSQLIKAGMKPIDPSELEGPATSAYRMRQLAKTGESPGSVPWYVRQYDESLNSMSLGAQFNTYTAALGLGRLYKDEYGALPSIAAAIGSVLDKTFTYYGSSLTNYEMSIQEMDPSLGYVDKKAGFFENTLGFAAQFATGTAAAVLGYFLIGAPMSTLGSILFRSSLESMLEFSMAEGVKGPRRLGQIFVASTMFGSHLGFKQTAELKSTVRSLVDASGGEYSLKGALPLFTNSMRARGTLVFANVLEPFIKDLLIPYDIYDSKGQVTAEWKKTQEVFAKTKEISSKLISITTTGLESRVELTVDSAGRGRQEGLARVIDDLFGLIPFNVFKTFWDKDSFAAKAASSTKIGSFFSFYELLEDVMGFQNLFNARTASAQAYTDKPGLRNTLNTLSNPIKKLGSAGLTGVKEWTQSLTDVQYKKVLRSSKALENLEEKLVQQKLIGVVDNFRSLTTGGRSQVQLDEAVKSIAEFVSTYEEYYDSMDATSGNYRVRMEASARAAEAADPLAKELKRYNSVVVEGSGLVKAKKLFFPVMAMLVAGNIATTDFMEASGRGVSLFTQLVVAIRRDEVGAAPEFTLSKDSPLLPIYGPMANLVSLSYSAGSAALAYSFAKYKMSNQMQQYSMAPELVERVATYLGKGTDFQDRILEKMNRGVPVPRGRMFTNFAYSFLALQTLPTLARFGGSVALSTLRQFAPWFVGEGGGKSFSSNFSMVAQMQNYRSLIIRRQEAGEQISNIELLGAYYSGIVSQQDILKDSQKASKFTVLAKQAPLPIVQFFLTQSVKARMFNDRDGNVREADLTTFSVGIQTAPIIGGSFVVSLPFGIQSQQLPDGTRMSSLVYNSEPNNIVSFVSSLAGVGFYTAMYSSALIAGLRALSISSDVLSKTPFVGGFFKDAAEDLDRVSKAVANFRTGSGKLYGLAFNLPTSSLRAGMGLVRADVRMAYEVTKTLTDSEDLPQSAAAKQNAAKRLSMDEGIGTRIWRAGMRTAIYSSIAMMVGSSVASISGDPELTSRVATVSAVGAGAYGLVTGLMSPTGGFARKHLQEYIRNSAMAQRHGEAIAKNYRTVSRSLSTFSKRASPFALFTTYGYLLTTSDTGYTFGMDEDLGVQLGTSVAYGALMSIPQYFISLSHSTPNELLSYYTKLRKAAKVNANPVERVANFYYNLRMRSIEGELNEFRKLGGDFLTTLENDPNHRYIKDAIEEFKFSVGPGVNHVEAWNKHVDQFAKSHADSTSNRPRNRVSQLAPEELESSMDFLFRNKSFQRFSTGNLRSPVNRRLARASMVAFGTVALTRGLLEGIASATGNGSGQDGVTNVFAYMEQGPAPMVALANAVKLITGWDRRGADIPVVEAITNNLGDQNQMEFVNLLYGVDVQGSKVKNAFSGLKSPFIINNLNMFVSFMPMLPGVAFSRAEEGLKMREFLQYQVAFQDISTAVNSAAPRFLFNQAINGRGQMGMMFSQAVKQITKGQGITENLTREQSILISASLINVAAEIQPLSKRNRRRFGIEISDTAKEMVSGDRALAMDLRDRITKLEQLSYQPIESVLAMISGVQGPNMLTQVGPFVDYANPTRALNPLENQINLFTDKKFLGGMIFHILNPLGRTSLGGIVIDKRNKEVKVEQAFNYDSVFWLEYSSIQFENFKPERPTVFDRAGETLSLMDNMLSSMPFLGNLKNIIYMMLGAGALTVALSAIGRGMFKVDSAPLEYAQEYLENMFGKTVFKATYPTGPNGLMTNNKLIIRRLDGTDFHLNIPEVFKDDIGSLERQVNGALESVMKNIQDITYSPSMKLKGGRVIQTNRAADLVSLIDEQIEDLAKHHLKPREKTTGLKESLKENIARPGGLLDKYVDDVFSQLDRELRTSAGSINLSNLMLGSKAESEILAQKDILKTELRKAVEDVVDNVIAGATKEGRLLKDVVSSRDSFFLRQQIVAAIEPTMNRLKNQLFVLSPTDNLPNKLLSKVMQDVASDAGHAVRFVRTVFMGRTVNSGASFAPIAEPLASIEKIDEIKAAQQSIRVKGRLSLERLVNRSFFIGLLPFQLTEPVDVMNSYNEFAMALDTGDESNIRFNAERASIASIDAIKGLGVSWLLSKIPSYIGKGFNSLRSLRGGKLGGIAAGLAALVALGYGARSLINNHALPALSSGWNTAMEKLGEAYEGAVDIGANILINSTKVMSGLSFGVIKPSAFAYGIGSLGATLSLLGTFVLGGVKKTTLLVAGAVGGTAGTLLSMVPGAKEGTAAIGRGVISFLSGVPGVGQFLAGMFTTNDSVFASNRSQMFDTDGTPFFFGTVSQAIATEHRRSLLNMKDATGARTLSSLSNPTLYGGGYDFGGGTADFGIRGASLIDPITRKDGEMRAQVYNRTVIGAGLWATAVRGSSNMAEIIKMEDPRNQISDRAIKGEIEKEVSTTQREVKKAAVPAPGNSFFRQLTSFALMQRVLLSMGMTPVAPPALAHIITNQFNFFEANQQALSQYDQSPLLEVQTSTTRTEDGKTVVSKEKGKMNDILFAVTGGLFNPLSYAGLLIS